MKSKDAAFLIAQSLRAAPSIGGAAGNSVVVVDFLFSLFSFFFSLFHFLLFGLSTSTCRCPLTNPLSSSPPPFSSIHLHVTVTSNPLHSSLAFPLLSRHSTMVTNGNRRIALAATSALLIACSFTPLIQPLVMAQVMPTPVQDFAWVRSGPYLYIEGGYVNLNNTPQFTTSQSFALDLSVSWPVTAAPWYALSNGTAAQAFYAVSSPNNQTILTLKFVSPASYTIIAYNDLTNTWGPPNSVTTVPDILSYGFKPVTDPTSGLVYIAGIASMNAYNIATQAWTAPGPIMTSMLTAKAFGAAVYNPTRKTIMHVGGYDYGVNPTHFDPQVVVTEYAPATNKWSVMNTTGTPPAPVADHCAAINDDGSTLIVFGGRTSVVTPAFTGNIFILDVITGVWTKGPAQATPRIYAACVIVGDQLVVWGGSSDSNNTLLSVEPIVFDITLKQWTNNYTAPAYYLNSPPPKPPGSTGSSGGSTGGGSGGRGSSGSSGSSGGSSSSSSSVSLGPIVGGVVGALAVIGAIVGFLIYRRRQNKKLEEVKEQVSQQRMVIEAEQSNRFATHKNDSRRNDDSAGSGGTGNVVAGGDSPVSSGGDNSLTSTSYPIPPSYYPNSNSNSTTIYKFDQSSSFPHLQQTKQFMTAVSSPVMSSQALRTPHTPAINNFNTQNPQLYQKPMFQTGVAVSGPQEYLTPTGRAPQVFSNESGIYHEQESGRVQQNHPQGEAFGCQ